MQKNRKPISPQEREEMLMAWDFECEVEKLNEIVARTIFWDPPPQTRFVGIVPRYPLFRLEVKK
jgi:hypothetical protein